MSNTSSNFEALVLMEATGGFEAAVACSLQAEGFDIAIIKPRQIRNFSHAMEYLAKTDRICTFPN